VLRRLFTKRRDTAAAIYGTILATSIVAGLSETHDLTPAQALEILVAGQVVLWFGHVYAGYLARKADKNSSEVDRLVSVAIYEWPMLRACVPAALAIVLWWLGALSENGAYWLALAAGIGELTALGFAFGRRLGQSVRLATTTALVDGSLGALLVLAKVLAS
jgi:hypothetical protein